MSCRLDHLAVKTNGDGGTGILFLVSTNRTPQAKVKQLRIYLFAKKADIAVPTAVQIAPISNQRSFSVIVCSGFEVFFSMFLVFPANILSSSIKAGSSDD